MKKATLTIADKIPIATGSFRTPLGHWHGRRLGGVNTQFTYTGRRRKDGNHARVHPDGQVTLKTSMKFQT